MRMRVEALLPVCVAVVFVRLLVCLALDRIRLGPPPPAKEEEEGALEGGRESGQELPHLIPNP